MLITQHFSNSFTSSLIKVLELQKHSVSNGKKSIWIKGDLPSETQRTVTIGLYQFIPKSMRLSVALTEKELVLYSSLQVENPIAIPVRRMVVLLKLLTRQLLKGHTYNNLKYITLEKLK